ncbi:MAG: hypothetical protein Q8L59_03780 [Phenylobacterium sp.]|uniref:hypothetical protein n=1 Tax=Phenylobacterium sp. TaxID=1871053 RepID=UPI002735F6CF|nr:hypothetical protein [Phenylobacterium sp.]MDP1641283.1 hypothetical protein [Phenylobacterium sp.]MDP3118592.1 hypothetical protein [Phenylobacterium sp.]
MPANLYTETLIRKRDPTLAEAQVQALAAVWDEVVQRIIKALFDLEKAVERELHINIKAEMAFELARLMLFYSERVVDKRVGERCLQDIDPEAERAECLGPEGEGIILETARIGHEQIWSKKMDERWTPKSRKALELEKMPRPPGKLAVKPVTHKHFISRWFIRDFWADGPSATRWKRKDGEWARDAILFAQWGHRTGLWDDRVEAYFALLEKDGKQPIEMLLQTIPLNQPQQRAFVGYLVIHLLRSPRFIGQLRVSMRDMLDEAARGAGIEFDEMARRAYATLFTENQIYDVYSRPIMWSQWAILTAQEPVFVLPDTFCARGSIDGEHRLIVPLTPTKCFVTLAAKEEEKRVVPFTHTADSALGRAISQLLIEAAQDDFLAHRDFTPAMADPSVNFAKVLEALGDALGDEPQEA